MKQILGILAVTGSMVASTGGVSAQDGNRNLTIVIPGALELFDPCRTSRDEVARVIKQNVTETLTELNTDNGSIEPRLAVSWEQVDDKTWRFHLREGVKFHDGSDFTADSVVAAIDRMLNPDLDCGVRHQYFSDVAFDSNVVDPLTLELTPEPAIPNLPTLFALMGIGGPDTPFDELETVPVGTGPYVFESLEPGQSALLTRNDDYWGEAPEAETVTYLARQDSAVAAAMVQAGEADLAPYIDVQDATNPETDISYLNSETSRLQITLNTPPLDDVRVRRALNLALDRQAFIGTIFSDQSLIATQIVLPMNDGYNSDLEPAPYDLEQAMALLAEAKADGVPVDRPIMLYGRPGFFPNTPDIMTALAVMWNQAGFNISTQMLERGQFSDLQRGREISADERAPAMFLDSHGNSSGDAGTSLYFKYHSDGDKSETADETLDALISDGRMASGEERTRLFNEAFAMLANDIVVDVQLFHLVGNSRVSPRITYEPTPLSNNELQIARIKFND